MERATKIFAAVYENTPHLSFEDIVDQFEATLRNCRSGQRTVSYDCDDIVLIEMPPLRIGMIWIPPDRAGQPHYLIVAVSVLHGDTLDAEAAGAVESRILEGLLARMPCDSLIRTGANRPVDSDLLDSVAQSVETFRPIPAPKHPFIGTYTGAPLHRELRDRRMAPQRAIAQAEKARNRAPSGGGDGKPCTGEPRPGTRREIGNSSVFVQGLLGAMNILVETAMNRSNLPRREIDENPLKRLRASKLH